MASDSTRDILVEVQAKVKNLNGLEKMKFLLEQEKKLSEDIELLQESQTSWAKEDAQARQEVLDYVKQELNLKQKIEQLEKKSTSKYMQVERYSISQAAGNAFDKIIDKINDIFGNFVNLLKNTLKNAWKEFQNVVSQSFLTNSQTRQNVLGYGLSVSQSYALEKAMSAMGINSMEDLLWMNESQSNLFTKTMASYTEKYDALYDSGFFEKELEFQTKIQEFKDGVLMKFVEFFVNNQDTITSVMNAILKIADKVMAGLSGIVGNSSAADVVNSYSNNKNVSVDMTYNISGQVNKSEITSAGEQTMKKIILAIQNS